MSAKIEFLIFKYGFFALQTLFLRVVQRSRAEKNDTIQIGDKLLKKVLSYRMFSDDMGKMNYSVKDVKGGLLIVSQFTLAADTNNGARASFTPAASPDLAQILYNDWVKKAHLAHHEVQTGVFAADMQISLVNDGPVTFWLHVH